MENTVISIKNKNGVVVDAEILLYFSLKDYEGKKYVLYTFNEKDDNGLVTIYASEVLFDDDSYEFKTIDTDEEWEQVQDVMRSAIKKGQEV